MATAGEVFDGWKKKAKDVIRTIGDGAAEVIKPTPVAPKAPVAPAPKPAPPAKSPYTIRDEALKEASDASK